MKRLTFALLLLLLASPAWALSTVYRHLEPETVVYQTLPSAAQTQFTTNENIKLIKYGSGITLSSITANLSQVNGTAFVSNPSVDLRPYVGFKGTWSDVGTQGVGFFGAAGTGEGLGPNLITGWVNSVTYPYDTFTGSGATITSAIKVGATGYAAANNSISSPSIGMLAKFTPGTLALTSGTAPYFDIFTAIGGGGSFQGFVTQGTWPGGNLYRTITRANYIYLSIGDNLAAANYALTGDAFQSVLSPSVTGTTIVSAAGGSTQSWTSMTVGFNLNDTTYTVAITRQK